MSPFGSWLKRTIEGIRFRTPKYNCSFSCVVRNDLNRDENCDCNRIEKCDENRLEKCDENRIKKCDENRVKKNMFVIKKDVFLKISDPVKRDLIVKEYLKTKKNIRDNLLRERTGEQQLQTDLSKIFKPVTETQKATAREITEGLGPLREGIDNLPQTSTFPAYTSIQAVEKPSEGGTSWK